MRNSNLHFSFALSASLFSFGVSLALTPVMARIFAPAQYGGFAIANSIATIGATVCLLSLPGALATARSNTTRIRITRLLILLGLWGALGSLVVTIGIHAVSRGHGAFAEWSVVLSTPLLLISVVAYRIVAAWSISCGEFRAQAAGRVAYAMTTRPLAIAFGYIFGPKAWIMILSETVAWMVQTAILIRGHGRVISRLWQPIWSPVFLRKEWKDNRTFTQFDYMSQLFLLLSSSAPIIVAGSVYGSREAGLFSLSSAIVSIPVMLISLAISPAMLHQITRVWSRGERFEATRLVRYFCLIGLLSVLGYGLLASITPKIFPLFLGEQWVDAGPIASLLCLPMALMFIVQPFYAILWLSGDAPTKLKIDAFYSLLSIAVLLLPCWRNFSMALAAWAIVLTCHRLSELALVGLAARRLRETLK